MKPANKYLSKALFNVWNHYSAILPYNLNWQITLSTEEKFFLDKNALVVCDVGARGAAPEELAPFFKQLTYHAFDADKEECDRLNASSHPYAKFLAFPYYIGKDARKIIFNIFKRPGESSSFKPAKRFQDLFRGDTFVVDREVELTSASLKEVYAKEGIQTPDFLKLDTQGSELEILQGAESVLDNVSMLEVEVEVFEMYEGQPLFQDVLAYLHERGFELLYFNRVFATREQIFEGKSRGQLLFGDALFGRREDRLPGLSKERIVKYILLLRNYGHIDLASHILKLHPELSTEFPMLKNTISTKGYGSKVSRVLFAQIDKIILLLLHFRKYNRLPYDSDRSWPSR